MKKKILIIVSIIVIIIICIVLCLVAFAANSFKSTRSGKIDYTPTFYSTQGDKYDIEIIQLEQDFFIYIDKSSNPINSIKDFETTFELFEYSLGKVYKVIPNKIVENNSEYIQFELDEFLNVYCANLFENKKLVPSTKGRFFSGLPAPSEAWMCDGVEIEEYPSSVE